MNNDLLKEYERIDDLEYKGLKIIQSEKEYSFTSDSVLLANFVKINSKEKSLELCSGSGVIGILAQAKNNVKDMTLMEIQPNMCDMASRSLKLNNLNNIKIVNGDIRKIEDYFEPQSFGYVLANPPYKKIDCHTMSEKQNINMSRYEVSLTLEELIKSVSYVLKYGGKFALIYDTDRMIEVFYLMKIYDLEPKKLQIIYPKQTVNSNVFMVEAIKNGKTGIRVLPSRVLG
ncbi:MAG: methyltransferase [Clostridia bacterium]|nr:methyltransferase [Clostridia bacterium]